MNNIQAYSKNNQTTKHALMQINITTIWKTSFKKEIIYTCKSNTVEKEAFLEIPKGEGTGVLTQYPKSQEDQGMKSIFPTFLGL